MPHETTRQAAGAARKTANASTPAKFTYALAAYTAEIRDKGWFVSRTTPAFGDKSTWRGPFATVDDVARSIAGSLTEELLSRHSRAVDWHGIRDGAPLHGLQRRNRSRKGKRTDEAT